MKLFTILLRKELLANVLSYRYVVTLLLFLLLVCIAGATRSELFRTQLAQYNAAVPKIEAIVADTAFHNLFRTGTIGISALKAPNPLAILVSGLENDMSRLVTLRPSYHFMSTAGEMVVRAGRRPLTHPAFRYIPALDVLFVVNIVCSLLALFLVYDTVCGERERGTLRVLLSGAVPRDMVILSKLCAAGVSVTVPLVAGWALALIYVALVARIPLGPDDFTRIALIAAVSVIYVGFFLALGSAVSASVQHSATSLAICLLCWVTLVLAVPNLVPLAVEHLVPTPSEARIMRETDAARRKVHEVEAPAWRDEFTLDSKYSREATSKVIWFEMARRSREELLRRTAALNRFQEESVRAQVGIEQAVARLSPSASYVLAATDLAGTGPRNYLAYARSVEGFINEYHEARNQQYRQFMDDAARNDIPYDDRTFDPNLWPRFVFERIDLTSALGGCLLDIGLLLGGAVLLFLVAYIKFIRYDVR